MESNARIHEQLVARATELLDRIRFVEEQARLRGFGCAGEERAGLPRNRDLSRFLEPSRMEAQRAQSAVGRIDRREFGCCILCGIEISDVVLDRFPYAVNCQDCSNDFPSSYVDDLRMQHTGLRRLAVHLQDEAARIRACIHLREDARPAQVALIVMILNLLRELPIHFAMEEKGGYLSLALEVAPQHHHRAQVLQKQHEELLRDLGRLRELVEDAESLDGNWAKIDRGIQRHVNDLCAHEEAENEILEDGFRGEIGGRG